MAKFGGPPKAETTKVCPECGEEFHPKSGAQVACPKCKLHRRNKQARDRRAGIPVVKEVICKKCGKLFTKRTSTQKTCEECLSKAQPGIGTGNWQKESSDNGSYKHGKYSFSWRFLEYLGEDNWYCNRCHADLRTIVHTKEGHGKWSVHHKDEDRTNQKFENLELLCVTCHNNHHKHWKHNWVCQHRPKPNKV